MADAVHLPKIGMIMEDAVLTRWLAPNGATVTAGTPIFEMDIEKVLQDVEAETDGILNHLVGDCVRLKPGAVVACITALGEEVPQALRDTAASQWSEAAPEYRNPAEVAATSNGDAVPEAPRATLPVATPPPLPPAVQPPPPEPPAVEAPPAPETFAPAPIATGRVVASPYARRLARQLGIDLATVVGSGPGGRITEADIHAVEAAATAIASTPAPQATEAPAAPEVPTPAPAAPEAPTQLPTPGPPPPPPPLEALTPEPSPAALDVETEVIAYAGRRRAIGERMLQSLRESAQLTITSEVRVDDAVRMAGGLSREWRGDRTVVTLTTLVIRAAARALREYPLLNARHEGDRIVQNPAINVGFAADAADGLMVPVIRDADSRPLQDVASDFVTLSRKTDNNELKAADVTDGTFTVTSLESSEIDAFTPILNPPQTAILGVARVRRQPVVGDGGIEVGQVTTLSLTFDHRVVDGAPAARFLGRVGQLLQRPYMLM